MSTCTHEPETYIGHGAGGHQWNCTCGRTMSGPEPERDDFENALDHHTRCAKIFRNMLDKGAPDWVRFLVEQSEARAAVFRELLACKRCQDMGFVTHLFGDQEWEESCDCVAGHEQDRQRAQRREDDAVAEWEERNRA